MNARRTLVVFWMTLLGLAAVDERVAHGQECRKTLLQWSYGTSFSGGADLDEPLVTDRPDFTESSSVVGLHVVQLEAGYTYTHDDHADGRSHSHTFPEALLRVGVLAPWCELRVGWGWAEELALEGGLSNTDSGSEDLYLGTKLALTPQEHILPETALILQTTVPTGSPEFTADELLPGVNFIYGWDVNDCCSTAGQTQFNRSLDDQTGRPYLEFSQSWTVGRSWTDRLGSYTEWFMLAPDGADTVRNEHYFDGGFTYLINNNVQWDIRAGVGLNDAADDFFVGTGFSFRRLPGR
jgi:hypothetical protein